MNPYLEAVRSKEFYRTNLLLPWGSGCGSVGRAVASNSRVLQFESCHWQKLIMNILLSTVLKRRK